MEAKDCLMQRRSCRKYLPKAVERETICEIMEQVRYAPSWKNTQITRYTVIEDTALKTDIAENGILGYAFNTKTIQRAPLLVVVSYETGLSGRSVDGNFDTPEKDAWEMLDVGISVQTFCLAAREYELGTCIIGVMDSAYIHKALSLPENQKVACLIALGYPEEWKSAPARKSVEDLLTIR